MRYLRLILETSDNIIPFEDYTLRCVGKTLYINPIIDTHAYMIDYHTEEEASDEMYGISEWLNDDESPTVYEIKLNDRTKMVHRSTTVATAIDKQESYNVWMSIDDGLPVDEDTYYLCKLENCKTPVICQYKEGIGFGKMAPICAEDPFIAWDYQFKSLEDIGYDKVLHWMKIPDMPEEKQ